MRAFESRRQKLLPFPKFVGRIFLALCIASTILLIALGLGIFGYHHFAGLSWLDALLNASMILTGMGPVDSMPTAGAKIFASLYALFSGIIFITVMAVILAPIFHRIIHKFHIDEE